MYKLSLGTFDVVQLRELILGYTAILELLLLVLLLSLSTTGFFRFPIHYFKYYGNLFRILQTGGKGANTAGVRVRVFEHGGLLILQEKKSMITTSPTPAGDHHDFRFKLWIVIKFKMISHDRVAGSLLRHPSWSHTRERSGGTPTRPRSSGRSSGHRTCAVGWRIATRRWSRREMGTARLWNEARLPVACWQR